MENDTRSLEDEKTDIERYDDCLLPHSPRNLQSCSTGSMVHSFEATPVAGKQTEDTDIFSSNIVIFGGSGVGKSSIVNLIADQKLAPTSNDASTCTFQYKSYPITLGNMLCTLWDTTGLDEGSNGAVPSVQGDSGLKKLMQILASSGGIDLLIYCTRPIPFIKDLKYNYDLFYLAACLKKVPIVLVTTGLEHEEHDMDMWWTTNEKALQEYGMNFGAHACVTTLDVNDPTIQQRRSESQKRLRDLVIGYSGRDKSASSTAYVKAVPKNEATNTPNIVILGKTGVGKSSVINLIAGQQLARASNDRPGYTFQHERCSVTLGETSCALWDTKGLDEGAEGAISAKETEEGLKELLDKLACSGGINLVIYCIRCSQPIGALKRNYDLFYVTACRKQVPVALVVTGLEHKEGEMDTWWTANVAPLRQYGMCFDAHACVTTLDVNDSAIQKRRSESQKHLRELVIEYSANDAWTYDSSFIPWVSPLLHNRISSMSNSGSSTSARKVTICDGKDVPGTDGVVKKHGTRRIGNEQYQTIRVDRQALAKVTREKLERVRGVGEGVLAFYMPPEDKPIPPNEIRALKTFFNVAGGRIYPVIVVLRGCRDERVAQAYEVQLASHSDLRGTKFISLAVTIDDQGKVDETIERLCIEQAETNSTPLLRRISHLGKFRVRS